MKAIKKVSYVLFILVVFSFFGCDRTESDIDIPVDVLIDNSLIGNPVINDDIVAVEYTSHISDGQEEFDWENLEYLPLPSTVTPVPMPWNDNASRAFSDDIRYDMKKSDGWVLYLSTFSSQINPGVKLFMLYNKYRGIIRYYYYLNDGPGIETVKSYNILLNNIRYCRFSLIHVPIIKFCESKNS